MYYNLKRTPEGYRMVKFDSLYNVEAVYYIRSSRGKFYCDCPAYKHETCKHRSMIPLFIENNGVDTGKFLCFDTGEWFPPVEGLRDDDIRVEEPARSRRAVRPTRKAGRRYDYGSKSPTR